MRTLRPENIIPLLVPKRQGDPAGAADGGQGEQLGRRDRVTVSLLHSPPLTQHHVIARDQIPETTKTAAFGLRSPAAIPEVVTRIRSGRGDPSSLCPLSIHPASPQGSLPFLTLVKSFFLLTEPPPCRAFEGVHN